jgi:hypothetical protein
MFKKKSTAHYLGTDLNEESGKVFKKKATTE